MLWIAALPSQRFRMFPDGVSYVALAEHLLAGRWGDAINAYWSPLYSWLLAPFLAAGADPFLAARSVGLLSALVVVWALGRACEALGTRSAVGGPVVLATVPLLILASAVATPDLLLVGVCLVATVLVACPAAARHDGAALLAGLAIGLGYLTKLIALPALVGVTVGVTVARWWSARRRGDHLLASSTLRRAAVTLAGTAAVVAVWGLALTVSTGVPTIGTAAAVNLQVAAADASGSPIYSDGLFAPATPAANNIWEDPAALPPSSPADGGATDVAEPGSEGPGLVASVRAEIDRRTATVRRSLTELERLRRFRLTVPMALALHVPVLVAWRRRRLPEATTALVGALLALSALTAAGTLAVHLEERYVWVTVLALLPGATLGLQLLDGPAWRRVACCVLLLALVVGLAGPGTRGLVHDAGRDHHLRDLAEAIDAEDDLEGLDVASDLAWPETLVLCLHLGCRYHGLVRPDRHDDFAEQLEAHEVDRFLWWDEDRGEADGTAYLAVRRGGPWEGEPRRVVVDRLDPP